MSDVAVLLLFLVDEGVAIVLRVQSQGLSGSLVAVASELLEAVLGPTALHVILTLLLVLIPLVVRVLLLLAGIHLLGNSLLFLLLVLGRLIAIRVGLPTLFVVRVI